MAGTNGASAEHADRLDLIGTFEAHLILGVERSRIARFLHENAAGKDKIPRPVSEPQCGPIWHRTQILARADRMYSEARHPYGKTAKGRDQWIRERARRRADALPNPLDDVELARVLNQPAPALAAA